MKKIFLIFGLVFVIVNLWAQTERDTVNVVTPSDISNISAVEDGTLLFTIVGDTVFYKVPASYLRDYITPKWWPDNTPADGQILRYSASGDSMIYAAPQFDSTRLSQDTILLHYLNGLIVNRDTIRGFRSSGSQLDTLGFQGDSGGIIERSDGENLTISGAFGVNTSGAGSTISIEADTSEVATLISLQDTAAAIRGDFPSGGDGNGLISSLPSTDVSINASYNDLTFSNVSQYMMSASDYRLNWNSETFIDLDASNWLFSNEGDLIVFGDPQEQGNGMKYVIDGDGVGLYPAGQNVPHFNFVFGDSIGLSMSEALMTFGSDELDASNVETFTGWPFLQSEIDGSVTNEIQDLSYTTTTGAIGITGGTGVAIPVMTGATSGSDGEIGLVPKALAGEESLFLRADGTYANPTVGGDNWGGQVVQSDNTLSGDGTSGDQLKVDTTVIASFSALQDSSAAIRGDFPVDTNTQLSEEQVEDFVGGMVTGNTETLITVTYQDGDGTVDFEVNPNLSNYTNDAGFLTSEADGSTTNELQVFDVSQLIGTDLQLSISNDGEATKVIDLSSLQDGAGTDDQQVTTFSINANTLTLEIEDDGQAPHTVDLSPYLDNTDTQLTDEQVEDIVGAMVSGNTETLISVTYDDVNGVYNFVVEGNLSNFTNDAGFLTSEVDGSTSNELQTLSANDTNSELTISSGNTIDLSEFIQEEVFRFLISGTGIGLNYDDFSNALEISSTVTGTNFSITADAGGTETISDSELIDFEGDFGVSTLRSSSTINFEVDTSEVATLTALQDSSAAIRADFPAGGTMDGFFLSSAPGDGFLIGDQDTTMFLTLPGLDHTRSGNQMIFDLAFNELSPYNGQFIDTLRLATYNQTTGQHMLLDPASLYNYFIDRIGGNPDAFGIRIETAFNSTDDASYYFTGVSPVDSIQIFSFDGENYIKSSSNLKIQGSYIDLSPATDLRITNTMTTDNTNLKVLAVDPLSKIVEEVEVSSFGVGGDGNGMFSGANNGGTVGSDYVINLTDTLSFEGGVFRTNATERIDLNFTSTPDRYTFYSTKDEGNIIDIVQRAWEVSTELAAGTSYRVDYGNNQAYSAFAAEGDGVGEYSAYMFVDDDTPSNSYASIRVENIAGSNELTGFYAYRDRLEMKDDNATIMTATSSEISLGNYSFDVDQTVGAGQDDYVMTYDNASGQVRLEAPSGGGGDPDQTLTWTDGTNTLGISGTGGNDVVITGFADQTHATNHLNGGSDEIDGDQIDIDFVPSTYSRTTIPSEVDNIAELTSHLAGIDNYLDVVETDDVGSQTSGSLDWGAEQGRVIKIDMTGASSKTLTFSNPKNSGVYTVLFLNADDADSVTWPGAAIYETGAAIGTDALSSGRRMFTMVYDGTNYYVAGGY